MLDSIIRTGRKLPLERLHALAEHAGKPLAGMAYRRRLVAANLARAFPSTDVCSLVDDFYTAFAQVCVEVLHASSMDAAELRERVVFEGTEALNDRNAVLLMAHHGNLVWAVTGLALAISTPVSVVYKTPHVAAVGELLLAIAERFGVDPVPVKEVRRRLVASRRQCRVWTIVADQRPGKERHYAELCGQRTAFFTGPERIARTMRWPVYYLSCRRSAAGRYRCVVEKVAEPPFEHPGIVVERYAQKLQADIDHAPSDWLWSHDRWRPSATESPERTRLAKCAVNFP